MTNDEKIHSILISKGIYLNKDKLIVNSINSSHTINYEYFNILNYTGNIDSLCLDWYFLLEHAILSNTLLKGFT